jgi:small GTP-binding protein
MAVEPGKIRNVAVVGHRGTGKTSLIEALLFQAGAANRLGTVESGSTVSDWDEDEQRRQMSLSASICHLEWQGRKINLIDTPGDAGFQGDAIAALRVVEGALFVLSAVMGVEVQTSRHWQRAEEADLSRVLFVNMLDRERDGRQDDHPASDLGAGAVSGGERDSRKAECEHREQRAERAALAHARREPDGATATILPEPRGALRLQVRRRSAAP